MNVPAFTAEASLYKADPYREVLSIAQDMRGQVVFPQYYHIPPQRIACWWDYCYVHPITHRYHCAWVCGGVISYWS
jgi:hypothetical protein